MLFTETPQHRELERLMKMPPKYIKERKERKETSMNYRNEIHQSTFTKAAENAKRTDNALMAALYLLTADTRLWPAAKDIVERDRIHLDRFHPKGCSPNEYTLLCAAKDLYLGTNHMTLIDLADSELVPPKLFALICNAMAIRRYGVMALVSNAS